MPMISLEPLHRALRRRDWAGAERLALELLRAAPDHAEAWRAASAAALAAGRPEAALERAERAVALAPEDPRALKDRGLAWRALGWFRRAAADGAAALARAGTDAALLRALGDLFSRCEAYPEAREAYARALTCGGDDLDVRFNHALVCRFLGEFEQAERDLDHVIDRRPHDGGAWLDRSGLRRQTPENNHVGALEQALTQWSGKKQEIPLRFALAKELEDLGRDDEAWAALERGCALKRASFEYDVQADVEVMRGIEHAFPASPPPAPNAARPIFILGLPRSGSTLIERILASHPAVTSAGEADSFVQALLAAARRRAGAAAIPRERLLRIAPQLDMAEIGAGYGARIARRCAGERVIDKTPLNFLYVGLIAAALPGAAIIHTRRHPMANAFGMYKVLFNQGYPFSYRLAEIAAYMGGTRRLMAHWRAVLGDRLIEIEYEGVLADQERQTRRLLDACGLGFDPACLAFHENPSPTTTQSAVQVRKPIDPSAKETWRRFSRHLAPLREALRAEGFTEAELG